MMRNWFNLLLAAGLFIAGNFGFSALLDAGMRRTYGLSKDAEVLILGHSHVMLALDAAMMEKSLQLPIAKYTREGVTVAERKLMAEQYLAGRNADKLRFVIYGVDPYLFNSGGLSENSYVNFYPMLGDPVIAGYLKPRLSRGEYGKLRLLPLCRYQDTTLYSGLAGWVKKGGASFKTGRVDVERARRDIASGSFRRIAVDPESLEIFRQTIRLFTDRGVRVILLNTPILDLYNQVDVRGHAAVEALFQAAAGEPLLEYWDFNAAYEHNYELFRDPIHLNRRGQAAFTQAVIAKWHHEIDGN